jgi:hypothetical protein
VVAKPGGTEVLMKEDFVMIQALVKRGVYQQDIATLLGVHPKTVRRTPARTGAPTGPAKRGSLLDQAQSAERGDRLADRRRLSGEPRDRPGHVQRPELAVPSYRGGSRVASARPMYDLAVYRPHPVT